MVTLSRRASWFLLAFGVWSWWIWLTFLVNISRDARSWSAEGAPTGFYTVHLVLIAVSLVLGTVIGVMGFRGLRAIRRQTTAS